MTDLTGKLNPQAWAAPEPRFDAFIKQLPSTHWARYDLSAVRLGWEMHKLSVDPIGGQPPTLAACPYCGGALEISSEGDVKKSTFFGDDDHD